MKSITSKLACKQLKNNQFRSVASIIAIALSTALTTAICCLVSSADAMLSSLYGKDYGKMAHGEMAVLLIPAVVFGLLILFMSVTVISNVFKISAGERTSQFGTLKCVGATQRQIVESVLWEALYLSAAGITIGFFLGLGLAYLGVLVAGHYVEELNSLVRLMVRDIRVTLQFAVSWKACAAAILLSLFTVIISAYLPAKHVAKKSAIDCIRRTGEVQIEAKRMKRNKWIMRIFQVEGDLAWKNWKRNKRMTKASVTSLAFSIVLFLSLGGLYSTASGVSGVLNMGTDRPVFADYCSDRERHFNEQSQRYETHNLAPISSEEGNRITEILRAYENADVYGFGNDYDMYYAVLERGQVTDEMAVLLDERDAKQGGGSSDNAAQKEEYEFSVEVITLDEMHYEQLCRTAGVPTGAVILLNDYSYNDNGYLRHIVPFDDSLQKVSLFYMNGEAQPTKIDGMIYEDGIPEELIYPHMNELRLIVPKAVVRNYDWMAAPKDVDGFMSYAQEVLDREFPGGREKQYEQLGFITRVYMKSDFMKVMNMSIVFATIFLYAFATLLAFIGVTNLATTSYTNIKMRSREFAMLQSIGMTSGDIRKMLSIENLFSAGKALVIGVIVGLGICGITDAVVRKMLPVASGFPWKSLLICVICVIGINFAIQAYASRELKKQNIIETIRTE